MVQPGAYSYAEITAQGDAWRSALDAALGRRDELLALFARASGRPLLFIGCGSTHYLALFAAPWFQRVTGRTCRAAPSSELLLQTDTIVAPHERPLVVALSRSGETSETVLAVEKMRARGCDALTISCYDATPLSRASTMTIGIAGAREESYAQTRSFASMLVAAQVAGALVADDAALLDDLERLPGKASPVLERCEPLARRLGGDETVKRITFLGSGPMYGLANEATVKAKEMSLSLAEAYHFMEFRHGPMSLVDREHVVIALLSESMLPYELSVLRDLKERGARVVGVGNGAEGLSDVCEEWLTLDADIGERARPVLVLPFVQLFAYHRAMARHLNPDRPRNVVMAIRLDGTEMTS